MASTDFERVLLKDDRVGYITDKVKYGVLKGGQNGTRQTFNTISKSTRSMLRLHLLRPLSLERSYGHVV